MGGLPEEPQVNKGKSHHPRLLGGLSPGPQAVPQVPSSDLAVTALPPAWPSELMSWLCPDSGLGLVLAVL